jgi:hypothetical protein
MVFAVNPTSSQTYDAFKAKAMGKSVASASSTSKTASPSASTSSGYGYGSSGATISIQKIAAVLAGIVFVGLLA